MKLKMMVIKSMKKFKYLLSNSRKFHHPEVAKVLYEHEKLTKLVCGSPWFKLKDKRIGTGAQHRSLFW